MATGADVLSMLIPEGGWIIQEDNFNSIIYVGEVKQLTKQEFENGFAVYDTWNTQQKANKTAARQAVLDRLGLTEEEAQLIIGGSN